MCNGNQQQFMLLHIQQTKLYFGLIVHVLGTTTFSKGECKRMGKRIYGIRSFAYRIRMPQPQAANAYRVYGILALQERYARISWHNIMLEGKHKAVTLVCQRPTGGAVFVGPTGHPPTAGWPLSEQQQCPITLSNADNAEFPYSKFSVCAVWALYPCDFRVLVSQTVSRLS